MLAVWSLDSHQLSATSGYVSAVESCLAQDHSFLWGPRSSDWSLWEVKGQGISGHAGQFQRVMYTTELSMGSSMASLDLCCCSISPSTHPVSYLPFHKYCFLINILYPKFHPGVLFYRTHLWQPKKHAKERVQMPPGCFLCLSFLLLSASLLLSLPL